MKIPSILAKSTNSLMLSPADLLWNLLIIGFKRFHKHWITIKKSKNIFFKSILKLGNLPTNTSRLTYTHVPQRNWAFISHVSYLIKAKINVLTTKTIKLIKLSCKRLKFDGPIKNAALQEQVGISITDRPNPKRKPWMWRAAEHNYYTTKQYLVRIVDLEPQNMSFNWLYYRTAHRQWIWPVIKSGI